MDDRESGDLYNSLMDIGIYCHLERLSIGDYVDDELDLCIEYKTVDDFCLSIMDGRIESQVPRMVQKYKNNFVIISGRDYQTKININCVIGMMSKLVLMGVHVLWFDNVKQCAFFIKRVHERLEKTKNLNT